MSRGAVHARAHQQRGPVAFAPAPLARFNHERARVVGGILGQPELLRGEVHRAVDVGEVRRLLVAEHRARDAGRRAGCQGETGARGREVLPARAPVVQEDAMRAILVVLHGGGERALGQDVAARRANLAPEVELVPHLRLAARGAARGARRLAAHRGDRAEKRRAGNSVRRQRESGAEWRAPAKFFSRPSPPRRVCLKTTCFQKLSGAPISLAPQPRSAPKERRSGHARRVVPPPRASPFATPRRHPA